MVAGSRYAGSNSDTVLEIAQALDFTQNNTRNKNLVYFRVWKRTLLIREVRGNWEEVYSFPYNHSLQLRSNQIVFSCL